MDMPPNFHSALLRPELATADLGHILRAVRTHLGMDVGFVSEFVGGRRVFRHVETATGKECIEVGGSDPLEESYCYWIAEGKLARLICDPNDHPVSAALPVTQALPVGAHLSVPIKLRDGRTYGTFCCFSFKPNHSFTERDMATMEAFAEVAACQIQDAIDASESRATKIARIESVLKGRDLTMVFQPAFHTCAGEIAFYEALARIYTRPYQSPDQWFRMATEIGLAVELELLALNEAIHALSRLPRGSDVSFNASPDLILSRHFDECMQAAPLDRLIVEITEHEMVSHYALLNATLTPLRQRGLRVAVDDMGAGYSSLRHILHIKPDIIKLDISLVRGIDGDAVRRALASALVCFARETGSKLVAEGVETDRELETLRALGADMVQGFFLGRPQPLQTC
jgi:EAL domain-containing protein (putative c-di-GMP-specific phosphodiesterase class I)